MPDWADVPGCLLRKILLLVRLDDRAVCACVCSSWRPAAEDPELWADLRLDASRWQLLNRRQFFLGAMAKAGASLRSLDARAHHGWFCGEVDGAHVFHQELLAALAAGRPALRRVDLSDCHQYVVDPRKLLAVSCAAPSLLEIRADLCFHHGGAIADRERETRQELMLQGDAPWHKLRFCEDVAVRATNYADAARQLCPALLKHAPRKFIMLCDAPYNQPAAEALLLAALWSPALEDFQLMGRLSMSRPAPLTCWARVADALARAPRLRCVNLHDVRGAGCAAVLRALVGHPALEHLSVRERAPDLASGPPAWEALESLLGAGGPLREADLLLNLGPGAAEPIARALAANPRLEMLTLRGDDRLVATLQLQFPDRVTGARSEAW